MLTQYPSAIGTINKEHQHLYDMAQTTARPPSARQEVLERQTRSDRNTTGVGFEAGSSKKSKRETTGHVEAPRSLLWAAGHGPTSFMQLRWGNLCLVATAQTEGKWHAPCQWAVPPTALFAMPLAPASCAAR